MSTSKLDQIRSQIAHRQAEIEFVASAPRSVDEAVAVVMAEYDRVTSNSLRLSDALAGHTDGVPGFFFSSIFFPDAQGDIHLLLQLIGREHIEKQARKFLATAASKQPAGLSAADRAARIASLKAEIAKLEIDEEKTILQLEADGGFVARRHDADPKIILAAWRENLVEKIA